MIHNTKIPTDRAGSVSASWHKLQMHTWKWSQKTLYYRHLMHVYDHAVYASLCPGYFDLNSDSRHDNATVTRGEMGVWDHTRITAINSKFAVVFVFGIVALKIGTRFNCSTAENNGSVICFVRFNLTISLDSAIAEKVKCFTFTNNRNSLTNR